MSELDHYDGMHTGKNFACEAIIQRLKSMPSGSTIEDAIKEIEAYKASNNVIEPVS